MKTGEKGEPDQQAQQLESKKGVQYWSKGKAEEKENITW